MPPVLPGASLSSAEKSLFPSSMNGRQLPSIHSFGATPSPGAAPASAGGGQPSASAAGSPSAAAAASPPYTAGGLAPASARGPGGQHATSSAFALTLRPHARELIVLPPASNSFPLRSTCTLEITFLRTRNRTVLRQRHHSNSANHSASRCRQISRDLTEPASTVTGSEPPSSPVASSSAADSS